MKIILTSLALLTPTVVLAQPSFQGQTPQAGMPMNPPMNPSKVNKLEQAATSYAQEVTYDAVNNVTSSVQNTANTVSSPNEKLTYGVVSTIGAGVASGAAENAASNIASGPPTGSDVANAASTAVYSAAATAADNVDYCAQTTAQEETIAAIASGSSESANSKMANAANTSKVLNSACVRTVQ